jgi:hypothetical protein
MKLLFLRSQLVDIEFRFGGWDDFGDVKLGFYDLGSGWRRLNTRSRSGRGRGSGHGGAGLGNAGYRADGWSWCGCWRWIWNSAANGLGDLFFEEAAGAGLQRERGETRKNFESGGEGGGRGLGAKHWRKGVGGLAAGTSGDNVVDGLLKLVARALNALEIVPQDASYGLFDSVGFR